MKLKLLGLSCLILSSTIYGASIDHIQNYSAEYGGNPAQQGAINTGSSVYFNPASLTKIEDGTYIVGGLQYAFGEQSMTAEGRIHDADLSSPIPNFALYKVQNKKSSFFTLGAVAGGAELEYDNSIPLPSGFNNLLKGTTVTGANQYIQMTLGKSFEIDEKISASFAIRGVYGMRSLEANTALATLPSATASIDSTREAFGAGYQIGINFKANENLNIGMRYDSQVNLSFETDADTKDSTRGYLAGFGLGSAGVSDVLLGMYPVYIDGQKIRRDLPALFAIGGSYKINDDLTTFLGANYYFNKNAKLDEVGTGATYSYDNGYEVSLGAAYKINDKFTWIVGFNYADTGAPGISYSATEYAIDSTMIGTGIKYTQNESTEWTIAYNHYFYDTTTYGGTKYKKEISSIGLNFVKKI